MADTKSEREQSNTLAYDKLVVFWDQMRKCYEDIKKERMSQERAAQYLTKMCGFLITERNVRSAVDAGVVPSWPTESDGRLAGGLGAVWKRFQGVETRILELETRIATFGPSDAAEQIAALRSEVAIVAQQLESTRNQLSQLLSELAGDPG